jgi:hypothetical protein
MRTFGARFNPLDDELDEMLAGRVGKKYLPVENQKGVKTLVRRFPYLCYHLVIASSKQSMVLKAPFQYGRFLRR